MSSNNWFCDPVEGEVSLEEIEKNSDKFLKWNYQAETAQENGYEAVMNKLKQYTAIKYEKLDEEGKKAYLEEVYQIYRDTDVFPIQYFNLEGIIQEIQKCIEYDAKFGVKTNGRIDRNVVSTGSGVGTTLCNFLFPNLFDVPSKQDLTEDKKGAETGLRKFYNEKFLKRAIEFCFSYKNGCPVPSNVMGGLRLVGSMPTNFRPMNAKAIYERFCPKGGTIYDFSCGFGGRLLGALSSKNNYRYVGTDPCTETMYHLHQLGEYIEMVTGREDSYELHCVGSELFTGPENSVDFAFSSPPYFDLEVYSDEETQCFNKYPVLEDWLENYVRGTIKNIYRMLKPGCKYAVNIADFKAKGGKEVAYVDEWIRISTEEGMPLYDTVYLGVTARAGTKMQASGELKKENILVFKKSIK